MTSSGCAAVSDEAALAMTDDGSGGAGPKSAGIDLATLAGMGGDFDPSALSVASAAAKAAMGGIPAGAMAALTRTTGQLSAVEEAMRPYRDLNDRMKHLTGIAGGHSAFSALSDQLAEHRKAFDNLRIPDSFSKIAGGIPTGAMDAAARASGHLSAVEEAMRSFGGINDRMKHLTELAGGQSAIGKVAQQIAEQQKAIDALRVPESFADLHAAERDHIHMRPLRMPELPPNPILETNRRLERIEQRFEDMQDVAANAATIANGLQAHAAEFLVKFEKAATDNDRSAGRAIRLGAIAILIAIAMPLAQIVYTEFWRVPSDAADMQTVIADMHREIGALRQTQADVAGRLESALERSDQQTAAALREIGRVLAEQRPAVVAPQPPED